MYYKIRIIIYSIMLFIGRLCWWKEVHRDLRAPSPAESIPEDADQVSIVTRLIDVGLTLLRGGGCFLSGRFIVCLILVAFML